MKIFTHQSVDLDAVASVWAWTTFVLPKTGVISAGVDFRPANWNGEGMEPGVDEPGDVALDMEAGGKGLKGEFAGGVQHSCFASIVSKYCSPEDKYALNSLVTFVDAQDSTGMPVRAIAPAAPPYAQMTLTNVSVQGVLNAFREISRGDDRFICSRMSEIFYGMLLVGRSKFRAQNEADTLPEFFANGKVALLVDAKESATVGKLFQRGARVIVYKTGNDLGIIRESGETFRVDIPAVQALVAEAGELPEWFNHPAGFLFCRGSRKAPAQTPSRVDPRKLAEAVASLFAV